MNISIPRRLARDHTEKTELELGLPHTYLKYSEIFFHTFNDYFQDCVIGALKYVFIFQLPTPYIQEKEFGVLCTLFRLF